MVLMVSTTDIQPGQTFLCILTMLVKVVASTITRYKRAEWLS